MKGVKKNKYKKSLLKSLIVHEERPFTRKELYSDDDIEDDIFNGNYSDSDNLNESNRDIKARKRKIRKNGSTISDNIEEEYERGIEVNEPVVKKRKHLLPIKSGGRLVHRTGEVEEVVGDAVIQSEIDETVEDDDEKRHDKVEQNYGGRELSQPVSTAELLAWRQAALAKCRYKIGLLSSRILEDPQLNITKLKLLNEMLDEPCREIAVTVKKLVIVSLTEVFKDIIPSYQIKHQDDPNVKLKKDTAKLHTFEKSLLKQYRDFLQAVEKIALVFLRKKGDTRVHTEQVYGLGLVALNSICDLLVTHPYFNFATNIAKLIIPFMNNSREDVRTIVTACITRVFKGDKRGQLTLFIVRQINQFVKTRTNTVHSEVISVFMALKLKDVNLDETKESEMEDKKLNAKRKKLINMSKKERKAKRQLKQLEVELMETKAEENRNEKQKILTEVTKVIFTVYFRILKNSPTSKLICATLEGIARFAHTINLEFYEDLVRILCGLMDSGDLDLHQQLLCIQAVFTILSGQGESLNIDPIKFYAHLYQNILPVHAGHTYNEMALLLKALDTVVLRRRKRMSQQRALAYAKRTATLALHVLHNGALGCLATLKASLQLNKYTDILLELDTSVGQGVYLPELGEPEHCNAASSALFELAALKRHYHPTVSQMAEHLSLNVPTVGEGSLPPHLSKMGSLELFNEFSPSEMAFKPTIPAPTSAKMKFKSHDWLNKQLEDTAEKILSFSLPLDIFDIYDEIKNSQANTRSRMST